MLHIRAIIANTRYLGFLTFFALAQDSWARVPLKNTPDHPELLANSSYANDLAREVDNLMQDYDGESIPGASLAIFHRNQILLQRNYGLRDLEMREPAESSTNFRIASLTKAFTASAIMQLSESANLDINSKLTEIFDDFPSYGSRITLHHLLTHTSGLYDYENLIPANYPGQIKDSDVLELMKKQRSTYFTPGTRFRYSNTGYAILAQVVSKISGITFQDYLRDRIFTPLGMSHSVAYVDGENFVTNRAYGYSLLTSGYTRNDQSPTSAVLGDGGIYSSIQDFGAWYRMWVGEPGVLSPKSIAQMLTPNRLANGDVTRYGYGWFIDEFENHPRLSHTGSTVGQKHAFAIFPDQNLGILILTNRTNSAPWLIVDKIARMILDKTSVFSASQRRP